ncbi:larval cuticle protein 16/17-like [Nasonia vitripennis]|uniref:Uncharacterized protein n=1 Tax=Nasonia vitripennis TaxID=7425 RepID=A0A7M7Q1K8_NASVI|nr:larval cuticle protein 16/17-like [Nasonia vitripennis]
MESVIVVLAAFAAVAVAAPRTTTLLSRVAPKTAAVVKEAHHNNIDTGGYRYSYQTDDGQTRHETAEVVEIQDNEGNFAPSQRVSGEYSFIDPETNQLYKVTYTADDRGYIAKFPVPIDIYG